MLRRDFQALAGVRVREAKALARAQLYDGAWYLGGLAIESALKSAVARATQRYEFPDRQRANRAYTHNLADLLKLSGLEPRLNVADASVQASWATIKSWNIETRYSVSRPPDEVLDFLEAVAGRRGAGRSGVLRWLRQFW